MISQNTINEILNTAQVEDVIQDYVNLKRRGVNMIGLCPFHDEKTPSFTVSPAKNIYKCFGCGKGGNPVNFIMEHESLSYPEALRHLAAKYGIEIEETQKTHEQKQEQQLAESLYLINKFAAEHFHHNLVETDEGKSIGLSYFKERGFRMDTVKEFNLGYAINSYDHFTKLAVEKQYNIELLRKLGLVSRSDYDFYRGRVIFPIHNLSGKVIGFGGRILTENKKAPKYVNSPESEIYNKRKTLYGIYQAKTEIRKQDNCIMVEGYTDVISLHQSDVRNAVASSGTSLTKEQIRLVKRYTDNITVMYDGDGAGIKAALRGMDLILEQDMNVKLVLLPDKEDPDSYVKRVGTAAFKDYVEKESKDFILFKTQLVIEEAGNDPIKKATLLRDIVESISKISDTLKRSVYIQHCSKLLDIEERILVAETNNAIKGEIKKKRLEKDRDALREQRSKARAQSQAKIANAKPSSSASDDDNPYQYMERGEDDGYPRSEDVYEPEDPKQEIQEYKRDATIDHQERDLTRIIVTMGHRWYDDQETITVAEYIYQNIADMLDYFSSDLHKSMILLAYNNLDQIENWNTLFTNHQDEEIRSEAITFMASPYTYANWSDKGVELQTQKEPSENFEKDSYQAILRFKIKKVKQLILETERELKKEDISPDDFVINMRLLQKLQEQRNFMANELNTVIL